jgi:methyl-accepting chemotaxis protein
MTDRSGGIDPVPAWTDIARQVREINDQMATAMRAFATGTAQRTPPALQEPMARYFEWLAEASTAMTDPLRRLLDENSRLAERLATLAEQQRDMAEQTAEWAERQHELTDQLSSMARPFLEQEEALRQLHGLWSGTASGTDDEG